MRNEIQDKERSPWIDPDTPEALRSVVSFPELPFDNDVKRKFHLVFSDEFNVEGRTMHDGEDPRWTALHSDDLTNNPLHWYSHDAVKTENGVLNITLDVHPETFTYTDRVFQQVKQKPTQKEVNVTKEFRSGMVQSWNKFCFVGGIIEISAKLPGDPKTGGLWPAMWMMGNLARATYLDTTDHMWPFSNNVCSEYTRYAQEISACNDKPGYGMQPNRGRGAPEIDFFEVMYMDLLPDPLLSASLQVAPGKPTNRPFLGMKPNVTWYHPFLGNGGSLNEYFFGTRTYDPNKTLEYQTDTVSVNFWLNESFYTDFHKFRIEWEPPVENMQESPSAISRAGYIKWFIDGNLIAGMSGDDLQEISQTEIPSEPMYILFNQAVSKDWGFPDAWFLNCKKKCWSCLDPACECALPNGFCSKNIPASFEIDYVRVYQDLKDPGHILGCSPPSRPTAEWIEGHEERYILWHSPPGTKPLLPVPSGGMACSSDETCGALIGSGFCDTTNMACHCFEDWTGPNCLSAYTGNASVISHTHRFLVRGAIAVVAVSALLVWRTCWRKKKQGYETLPDSTLN